MRYTTVLVLATLVSALTCEGHAVPVDIRYYNPGSITYATLGFFVDGEGVAELPSGCPGPGSPTTGPICVAQIQLGEGVHHVKAKAFAMDAEVPAWTAFSNTINVQGAPEPALGVGLGLGALGLAWAGRRR